MDNQMNIGNNINAAVPSDGLSLLKSANKQPELALQLLMKSLAESQAIAQTPPKRVAPVVDPQGTGQIIDTVA